MKQLSFFVLTIISLAHISDCSFSVSNLNLLETNLSNEKSLTQSKTSSGRAKSVNELLNKKKKKAKKSKKIAKQMFLWEGWLKFIRLVDKPAPMRPNNFFVNPSYHYQKVFKRNMKKKDKKGYKNIKDKFLFFGVLKTEGLYIFKSRKITLDNGIEEILPPSSLLLILSMVRKLR